MRDKEIALECNIFHLNKLYDFLSSLRYLEENKLLLPCNLLESYRNVYRKSSAKRECHDKNMILKALQIWNTIFFHEMYIFLLNLKKYY